MADGDHTPAHGPLGAGAAAESARDPEGPQMANVLAGLPRVRPGRRAQRRAPAQGTGTGAQPRARAAASRARSPEPAAPQRASAGATPGAAVKAGANAKPKAAAGAAKAAKPKPQAAAAKPEAKAAAAKPRAAGKARAAAKPKAAASGRRSPSPRPPGQETSEVPTQGFETEDTRHGDPIQPPSRAEVAGSLIEAAAEGLEELVKAGAGASGAALKRALGLISNR